MRKLAGLMLAYFATPAAAFLAGPILARALGPVGRGELATASSLIIMLSLLFAAGLPDAAALSGARYRSSPKAFLSRHWIAVAALAVTAGFTTFVLGHTVYRGNESVTQILTFSSFFMPWLILVEIVRGSVKGLGRYSAMQAEMYISSFGRLGAILLLLATGTLSAYSAGAATTLALGIAGLVYTIFRFEEGQQHRANITRIERRTSVRYFASNVARSSNARLDQIVMLPLVGAAQLGLYASAVSVMQLATQATRALRTFVFTASTRRADGRNVALITRVLPSILLVPLLVGELVAYPLVVVLFGAEFRDSAAMLQLLLLGVIPAALTGAWSDGLMALGKSGLYATAEWISLIVTAVFLLLLLPGMGGNGAAIASVLACVASSFTTGWFFKRHAELSLSEMLKPTAADYQFVWSRLRGFGGRDRGHDV